MDTVKITRKDYFAAIAAMARGEDYAVSAEDIAEFCEKEIAALGARAEKAKERAAAKRAEGDALQDAVLAALTDEFSTRTEITERVEGVEEVTVAKVGYRLTQLVKNGLAVKDEANVTGEDGKAKKATVYKLA